MTLREITERQTGTLPALLGIDWVETGPGLVRARLTLDPHHRAPNGYLHAGTVVTLADTACGFGCMAALPDGAAGFTTIELKANFLGTVRDGVIACTATLVHGGRSTQIWDAVVIDTATDRKIALFRCTQMVLMPRGDA